MKSKTVFVCKECGNETPRWQGRCPVCGAWNALVEFEDKKVPAQKAAVRGTARAVPKKLRDVTVGPASRGTVEVTVSVPTSTGRPVRCAALTSATTARSFAARDA